MEGLLDEPDPQLLAAARSGDLTAFEGLVRGFQGDVWRLSFHLLGDRTLADDVTQDSFVRAFRFLPRFRGDSKFSTWLFAIARNCALDELRRLQRRKKVVERIEIQPEPQPLEPGQRIEVREAVAALPIELREAVVMIDMLGESYRDAAAALKVPEGTIKSRVHRARLILVQTLGTMAKESSDEA